MTKKRDALLTEHEYENCFQKCASNHEKINKNLLKSGSLDKKGEFCHSLAIFSLLEAFFSKKGFSDLCSVCQDSSFDITQQPNIWVKILGLCVISNIKYCYP